MRKQSARPIRSSVRTIRQPVREAIRSAAVKRSGREPQETMGGLTVQLVAREIAVRLESPTRLTGPERRPFAAGRTQGKNRSAAMRTGAGDGRSAGIDAHRSCQGFPADAPELPNRSPAVNTTAPFPPTRRRGLTRGTEVITDGTFAPGGEVPREAVRSPNARRQSFRAAICLTQRAST